jgi:hypothetical protein
MKIDQPPFAFFPFSFAAVCASLYVFYTCANERWLSLIRARPLGSHGRACRRRHGTLIAGRSQIKFCHHCALSECVSDALRATEANMEMRLLIASVACKLLIYGHLCVTLGLPGKSIAQSAKRLAAALLYWFSQSSLISPVPDNFDYASRTIIYAFGYISVVIGQQFDAVRT